MVPTVFTKLQATLLLNEITALKSLEKGSFTSILDFNFYGYLEFLDGSGYQTVYYTMDLEENGELFQYIEKTEGFSEKLARNLFSDLVRGVIEIHNKNIAHRDIKCENILLSKDYSLVLCDFGSCCSKQINHKNKYRMIKIKTPQEAVGSPEFNAPEIKEGEFKLTNKGLEKADVFSLGCVLFLMVVKSMPFSCASLQDKYYERLVRVNTKYYWKIFDKSGERFSSDFKDLFERMIAHDPEKRLTLKEILEHEWMYGESMDQKELEEAMLDNVLRVSQDFEKIALKSIKEMKEKGFLHHSVAEISQPILEFLGGLQAKAEAIQYMKDDSESSSDSSSIHEAMCLGQNKKRSLSETLPPKDFFSETSYNYSSDSE